MLNLWVVSLNKQRVSFSLSLSKRKINGRASLPTALRMAVIKKMTVLVTASTSFAQVPKIAQFYYQGIPFRDADNQPNLKTTAGYTNSNSNTGLHWILFISRLTRQKWEEALPCDCTAQAIVFNPGTLKAAENPGFGSNTPRSCTVPEWRGMCPLPGRFAVGVYPLCWPGASAGSSPHPEPPSQTAGEPPQNHISLLGQWSSPALACSGCRGRGRSSPALAVLWAEFLPGLHPANAAFPAQPPRKPSQSPPRQPGREHSSEFMFY